LRPFFGSFQKFGKFGGFGKFGIFGILSGFPAFWKIEFPHFPSYFFYKNNKKEGKMPLEETKNRKT